MHQPRLAAGIAATVAPYLQPSRAGQPSEPTVSGHELPLLELFRLRARTPFDDHLKAEKEKRLVAIYVLEIARDDGLLGPGLARSSLDCKGLVSDFPEIPPIPTPLLRDEAPVCGRVARPGRLAVNSATIPELAVYIGEEIGAPVVDQTGILGRFNATLSWTPGPKPSSFFTAIHEQLGLKLELRQTYVDVWFSDDVEHPRR